MLPLLCSYAQAKLPYKVQGVESNDDLYGGNDSYLAELNETINGLVAMIWEQLGTMEGGQENEDGVAAQPVPKGKRVELTCELVNVLMNSVKLEGKTTQLLIKLLELCKKTADNQPNKFPFLRNTLEQVQRLAEGRGRGGPPGAPQMKDTYGDIARACCAAAEAKN